MMFLRIFQCDKNQMLLHHNKTKNARSTRKKEHTHQECRKNNKITSFETQKPQNNSTFYILWNLLLCLQKMEPLDVIMVLRPDHPCSSQRSLFFFAPTFVTFPAGFSFLHTNPEIFISWKIIFHRRRKIIHTATVACFSKATLSGFIFDSTYCTVSSAAQQRWSGEFSAAAASWCVCVYVLSWSHLLLCYWCMTTI